jgi:RNA polymerase sigma-70 factor (ECF subfamily)
MHTDTPNELLDQAVAGDRLAIQRLLLRHHDRLVGVIAARLPEGLRGALSAEDVCQDAYVTAIRSIGTFRERTDEAFFAWLRTIAENTLIDMGRAMRALKRGGDGRAVEATDPQASSMIALLDLIAVDHHTPSQSAARRELVSAVRSAVDRLPDDYRDAVRLRYVQGLSALETAQNMGRGEGAVRMLCSRALRRLAEEIGDPSQFLSRT